MKKFDIFMRPVSALNVYAHRQDAFDIYIDRQRTECEIIVYAIPTLSKRYRLLSEADHTALSDIDHISYSDYDYVVTAE